MLCSILKLMSEQTPKFNNNQSPTEDAPSEQLPVGYDPLQDAVYGVNTDYLHGYRNGTPKTHQEKPEQVTTPEK